MDSDFTLELPPWEEENMEEEQLLSTHDREVEDVSVLQAKLRAYVQGKRNKETVKKTERDMKHFTAWLETKNERRAVENIPARTLDVLIGEYVMSLKKRDGSDYEPTSLTAVFGSIKRYLEDKCYPYNIMDAYEFDTCRKVLQSKRKELKSKGLGNLPNKAEALSDEEEERLWETGALGIDTPESLRASIWFVTSKFFGFRGRQEARSLTVGDLQMKVDSSGTEYVQFTERSTKTRQDGTYARSFQPKMWCNKEQATRCPVFLLREYLARRPADTLKDEYPLFLSINHKRSADSQIWYSRQAMGVNEISRIMPKLAKEAGINGRITNHSIRKTTCTKLLHEGVPPTMVAQLSGHRNVASLNNYSVASLEQQKAMYNILSNQKKGQLSILGEERKLPSIKSSTMQRDTTLATYKTTVDNGRFECSKSATQTTTVETCTDIVRYSQESLPPTQPYEEFSDNDEELLMAEAACSEKLAKMGKASEMAKSLSGMIQFGSIQGNITFNINL